MTEKRMEWQASTLKRSIREACNRGADIVYDDAPTYSPQQPRIWFRVSDGGDFVLIERMRHWSEGFSSYSRRINRLARNFHETFEKVADAEISMIETLQQMDAISMQLHGDRFHPVPHMMRCHPVGLALSRHMGMSDDTICRVMMEKAGIGERAAQDRHGALLTPVLADGWRRSAQMKQNRIVFDPVGDQIMEYADKDGSPVLRIRRQVPDTVLMAMTGLDLPQVVTHPAFDDLTGIRIQKAEIGSSMNHGPHIALYLNKALTPVSQYHEDRASQDQATDGKTSRHGER